MKKITQAHRPQGKKRVEAGDRLCLVTRETLPHTALIRFVIGPDQSVVPDLGENLPGHGLWVSASRPSIQTAVQKNLFAKATKEQARADPDLADHIAALLRKRCLSLLGLAKGAGLAVLGESQTESALREGKLALFLHAPDAMHPLDNRREIPAFALFSREEMGAAFGYEQIVYAGLMPHRLTQKLQDEIGRLIRLVPCVT